MTNVQLPGIRFEEWPTDFGNCFLISRNGLRGWRGGDLRREEITRPADHGAFDTPGYRAQVVPSLAGTILASSPQQLRHMKDRVMGVLADGSAGRMTVEDEQETTWRDVRLVSCLDPEDLDELSASFSLTFWAADPRRYGQTHRHAAGAPAFHYGNFPATPRLLVGAGSGGYTVTGPGGRVVVVSSAPAGAHYIDFSNGGLFTNAGVRQVGAVTTYQPWKIPPGPASIGATITGARSLVQEVVDTFA